MSIVRENLMSRAGYSPYCGNGKCPHMMPRTVFNGSQFKCRCGWVSAFPADFIAAYKLQWNLPGAAQVANKPSLTETPTQEAK